MTGMFETTQPGTDRDAWEKAVRMRNLMLRMGVAQMTIYLNGGSDTRRASREHWKEYADFCGISYEANGYMIKVGGWR